MFDIFEKMESTFVEPTCDFGDLSESSDNRINDYNSMCLLKNTDIVRNLHIALAASLPCCICLLIVCTPGCVYGLQRAIKERHRGNYDRLQPRDED